MYFRRSSEFHDVTSEIRTALRSGREHLGGHVLPQVAPSLLGTRPLRAAVTVLSEHSLTGVRPVAHHDRRHSREPVRRHSPAAGGPWRSSPRQRCLPRTATFLDNTRPSEYTNLRQLCSSKNTGDGLDQITRRGRNYLALDTDTEAFRWIPIGSPKEFPPAA